MSRCPQMCIDFWMKQDSPDGLLCPGCWEWVDKDGKKWRQINLQSASGIANNSEVIANNTAEESE